VNVEPKKIAIGLAAAWVALALWHNPRGAGESTGDFLSKTGGFLQDAFDKADEFSKSVIE
jgi:hypothetical protein